MFIAIIIYQNIRCKLSSPHTMFIALKNLFLTTFTKIISPPQSILNIFKINKTEKWTGRKQTKEGKHRKREAEIDRERERERVKKRKIRRGKERKRKKRGKD